MEELRVLQAVRLDNATPTERLLQLRLRQCGDANPSRSTSISIAELICRQVKTLLNANALPTTPTMVSREVPLGAQPDSS